MLGLTILNLEVIVETNGGVFSGKIKFDKGLNIIRAENSSGKSTLINAIAYGLGLEDILGPARRRPFAKSLYESICDNKLDENMFFVRSSRVKLLVENSSGIQALIERDVSGDHQKAKVSSNEVTRDYFFGSAGNVGSAKSERGFHNWLAGFIGWILPDVVKFDGGESKLYLQCIFPLFFIEQKRGWSEVQANTPTHYGIQNVKKSAIEFCLGIDRFEQEKKISSLKKTISDCEEEWDALRVFGQNIADINNLFLPRLGDFKGEDFVFKFTYFVKENDREFDLISKQKGITERLKELDTFEKERATDDANEKLILKNYVVNDLRREIEALSNSYETLSITKQDIQRKLTQLRRDYDQYQQLKRLRNVGSDISDDLNFDKCPVCEHDLFDTLSSNTLKTRPMSLDENISFLKNQIDFYSSILKKNELEMTEISARLKAYKVKYEDEVQGLNALREDLSDVGGRLKELVREKLQLEIELRNLKTVISSQEEFNDKAQRLFNAWKMASGALSQIKKRDQDAQRGIHSKWLQANIKESLQLFGFNPSSINSISVSPQTFRPEQDGYDIVAEVSASDYIRIIWAYTLSLMEYASKNSGVKHGGFVVLDEPRQHEANPVSFAAFIEKSAKSLDYGGQVIFATSISEEYLKDTCKDIAVNLSSFDDYVLKLESESSSDNGFEE